MRSAAMNEIRSRGHYAGSGWTALFSAWFFALSSSLGAIFIGEVMGQTPCELCWFQRAFMFPLAIMLGIAAYRSDRDVLPYAFALALAGWVIALYHLLLYLGVVPDEIQQCGSGPSCSNGEMTLFGAVPIPLLSLVAFSAILFFLNLYRRSRS
jgi:disulfide bond formation protein DsbB